MWGKKEAPKASPSSGSPAETSSYTPLAASRVAAPAAPVTPAAPEAPKQSYAPVAPKAVPVVAPPPVEISRPAIPSASVISKGLVIKGEITGNEDVQIEGEVTGTVRMPGARVMITPEGRTTGNIEAREVLIRGKLKGDVLASERVLVGQTGVWQGDSLSPRLVIEGGAVIKGKFEVTKAEQKKPAHAPAQPKKEEHLAPAEESLAVVTQSVQN